MLGANAQKSAWHASAVPFTYLNDYVFDGRKFDSGAAGPFASQGPNASY
jgi:hypothetical protein